MKLRLIADGQLRLPGRYQFRRRRRVGRRDNLNLKANIAEISLFLGDDQRPVVGIHKPVKQHGHLVGGSSRSADQCKAQQAG